MNVTVVGTGDKPLRQWFENAETVVGDGGVLIVYQRPEGLPREPVAMFAPHAWARVQYEQVPA